MATPIFGMYVSSKEFILITKVAAIMYGMYIINGEHEPEPRSLGGNIIHICVHHLVDIQTALFNLGFINDRSI